MKVAFAEISGGAYAKIQTKREELRMKSIPTISIIVPVFKTEKYIRQCVDSIIEQTYTDFELILVDDGSPDGCPIICEEYAKRDARVKVIHKKNEGVSAARNDGVQAAEGKYVAFVDSDDLMPGDALEKLAQHIENEEYDAIFGNHVLDYDGKRLPKKPRIASGKYSYLELRNRIIDDGTMTGFLFGSVWAGIYKRDILIRNGIVFNNNVRVNEDGLFNFEFICCCANVRVIEEYVYIYRQWKAAVKTPVLEKDRRFKDCEIALNEYIENRNEDFSTQLKRRRISIAFWNAIRIQDSKCNWKQARVYLRAILLDDTLTPCYDCLDYSKMNRFKKVLCNLMKNHRVFIFYVTTKYFVPTLKRILPR